MADESPIDFTVATYVVHGGKTLFIHHRKLKLWLPPGGHVDEGETPDQAAIREVKEEAGLDVELIDGEATPEDYSLDGVQVLKRPMAIQLENIHPGHQHVDLIYASMAHHANHTLQLSEVGEEARWLSRAEIETAGYLRTNVKHWAFKALDLVAA